MTVASFLYAFFPGLHGQLISVTYPINDSGLGPHDLKTIDRDEISRPRSQAIKTVGFSTRTNPNPPKICIGIVLDVQNLPGEIANNAMKKLNLERLTVRLGLTVIYFPIFRQARPDFFRVCLQLRKDVTI